MIMADIEGMAALLPVMMSSLLLRLRVVMLTAGIVVAAEDIDDVAADAQGDADDVVDRALLCCC